MPKGLRPYLPYCKANIIIDMPQHDMQQMKSFEGGYKGYQALGKGYDVKSTLT